MMKPETSMSPTLSTPAYPESIQAIQREISQIALHRAEHVSAFGTQVMRLDNSCKYCEAYLKNVPDSDPISDNLAEPAKGISKATIPVESENSPKVGKTVKDLQRIVDHAGKRGQISVPRTWAGKTVRVTLLQEADN